jgi:hypothetical protein
VKIYLPRFFGRDADDQLIEGELLGQGEGGETVLVVEDDDDVRAYLTDVLRGWVTVSLPLQTETSHWKSSLGTICESI